MAIIKSFRDWRIHHHSRSEAGRLFEMAKNFPKAENFFLTNRIRRSSRAVKSMIAEACVIAAIGEANETQSWLDDALDCGYITDAKHRDMDATRQIIGGKINNMILKAADFCAAKND